MNEISKTSMGYFKRAAKATYGEVLAASRQDIGLNKNVWTVFVWWPTYSKLCYGDSRDTVYHEILRNGQSSYRRVNRKAS